MKRTVRKAPREPMPTRKQSPPPGTDPEKERPRSLSWDDLEPESATHETSEEASIEEPSFPAEEHTDEDSGPDDALGLYLRQMGAIPLLSRKEELTLAQKLERQRQRYRHAALYNWR